MPECTQTAVARPSPDRRPAPAPPSYDELGRRIALARQAKRIVCGRELTAAMIAGIMADVPAMPAPAAEACGAVAGRPEAPKPEAREKRCGNAKCINSGHNKPLPLSEFYYYETEHRYASYCRGCQARRARRRHAAKRLARRGGAA